MRTFLAQKSDHDRWDEYAAKGKFFGLLQSWKWGEFKEQMGWKVYRIAIEEKGIITGIAQLLIKSFPGNLASIAYLPRGPMLNWEDETAVGSVFDEIHKIARENRAVFLKIEPPLISTVENHDQIRKYLFTYSPITNQPKNTIIIDIKSDENTILAEMRKKTRQYIRRAEREGIKVRIGTKADMLIITSLMKSTGKRQAFSVRSKEFYQKQYEILTRNGEYVLLIAEKDGQVLAFRTISAFGQHAAEFHAGSIDETDALHPNYLLVWEGIQWAKKRGCSTYDMWGIPDDLEVGNGENDPPNYKNDRGLWGVFQFKRGFCHNVVPFVGAYDFVYSKYLYKILASPVINREHVEKISIFFDSIGRTNQREE